MTSDTNYHRNFRAEVAAFLPGRYAKVLEIGCGEGRFRANLPAPCEYVGVEPSPAAAQVARGVLDAVHTGTFESVVGNLPDGHFDLVICNDVIEHMPDHDAFLEAIKGKMAPGACLAGSIPNVRWLPNLWGLMVGRDWEYIDHGILDRTHLRFFTERSWRRSLELHGYRVEMLEGITPLDLGKNPLKRAAKSLLINAVGADCRYLQFGWRAVLVL